MTAIAYAVYYTSATPTTDTLNPPPFTVPAGSGLAWSVPLAAIAGRNDYSHTNGSAGAAPGTPESGYELMSYAVATLTGANQYTLEATGGGTNHLNRAVYGAPPTGGVAHSSGARFAFVDPSKTGQLHVNIPPQWIGKTLRFKFPSYNAFGAAPQSLAGLPYYTYTIQSTTGAGGFGGGYQLFQVNGS